MCHPQSGRRVLSVCPSSRFAFVFLWFWFGYGWVATCKDDTPTEWCENQRVGRVLSTKNKLKNKSENEQLWQIVLAKRILARTFSNSELQNDGIKLSRVCVNISASRQTLHLWYSSVVLQLELLLTGTHTNCCNCGCGPRGKVWVCSQSITHSLVHSSERVYGQQWSCVSQFTGGTFSGEHSALQNNKIFVCVCIYA